jgi:hypothetical protein
MPKFMLRTSRIVAWELYVCPVVATSLPYFCAISTSLDYPDHDFPIV